MAVTLSERLLALLAIPWLQLSSKATARAWPKQEQRTSGPNPEASSCLVRYWHEFVAGCRLVSLLRNLVVEWLITSQSSPWPITDVLTRAFSLSPFDAWQEFPLTEKQSVKRTLTTLACYRRVDFTTWTTFFLTSQKLHTTISRWFVLIPPKSNR